MVWIVWWRFSVLQEFRKEEELGRIGLGRAPISQSVVTSSVVWIRGENMVCPAKEGWQARHESLEQRLVRERSPWGSYVQEGWVWHELESSKRRTSQAVHWLRICLPVQGTRFHLCSGKILHARGQISLCVKTTEAHVPRACALQQEKPLRWETHAAQLARVSLTCHNKRKPTHNKDPAQPKINK